MFWVANCIEVSLCAFYKLVTTEKRDFNDCEYKRMCSAPDCVSFSPGFVHRSIDTGAHVCMKYCRIHVLPTFIRLLLLPGKYMKYQAELDVTLTVYGLSERQEGVGEGNHTETIIETCPSGLPHDIPAPDGHPAAFPSTPQWPRCSVYQCTTLLFFCLERTCTLSLF